MPKLSRRCARPLSFRSVLCVLCVILLCRWFLALSEKGWRSLGMVKPSASAVQGHLLLVEENSTCWRIIRGDRQEVERVLLDSITVSLRRQGVTEGDYLDITRNCSSFLRARKYITVPLSPEEENFPLAFSMVIHNGIEMFERLLRSIYAPQNVYCIHVDRKSPSQFHAAVQAIASCFHNVFVAAKLESVTYASWARVQADLNCMEELLETPVPWRYFINMCGQDFPLKTNREIVHSLKAMNGSNVIESDPPPRYKKKRWQYHHDTHDRVVLTGQVKEPPDINSSIFVGSAYVMVTREFATHVFASTAVRAFLKWSEDTYSPDEHVWATLLRMRDTPGYVQYTRGTARNLGRAVKWSSEAGDVAKGAPYSHCTGMYRHMICVYGAGDLQWLLNQRPFFANKFDPDLDNVAVQCMEEYLRNRTLGETGAGVRVGAG
ncbi:beta-1,3-galactosyl-O-glycosyl-glycoprotein beta-1,6-N-acetylglucosaminyltransferase 3-like [Stegostoma tigrinum]|uniref:beta-1,3-galactosyl-O-glycosyl-glycoprotein beta-1,6-N-acetylglucosaminyltransferase 3-like n=1 Tax=Stegostoma tigrinum TaxID=3053191 RepID=UPI00202B9BD5|nr:beta-1,3-galactosyl-O-glycosyl-glycoprotein beta-1,6-N-acetylglucosaminyltransferase 3-like [Stegostoma tigrinum]